MVWLFTAEPNTNVNPFDNLYILQLNCFSLKCTSAISFTVEKSNNEPRNPLVTVYNEINVLCCRLPRDICFILQSTLFGNIFAGISKSQPGCCGYKKDVWTHSFAQVSRELQRYVAVEQKQKLLFFFPQTKATASSNETIKNDFLDRTGRPLF